MRSWLRDAERAWASRVPWTDLPGDALAATLAGLAGERRVVVLVDEPDAAERLARGLRFFLDERRVAVFPADDVRPYDGFSASAGLPAERARVLQRWERGDPGVVVVPVRAAMQRLPGPAARARATLTLTVGSRIDRDDLVRHLTETGWLAAPDVSTPGLFAVRGDVVDVWVPGSASPRRIDLFDDEVERLRQIDPRTGRTRRLLRSVVILPMREEPLFAEAVDRLQAELGQRLREGAQGLAWRRRVVEELRAGIRFSGLEDLLPGLVEVQDPLDALAGGELIVVHPGSVLASARALEESARGRWAALDDDERPLIGPEERFVAASTLAQRIEGAQHVVELAGHERARGLGFEPVDGLRVQGTELQPAVARLHKLADDGLAVAVVARDTRQAELLHDLVQPHGLELVGRATWEDLKPGEVGLLVGDLPRGFIGRAAGLALVPASALFGRRETEAQRRAHTLFDGAVSTLSALKEGDPVVHRLHGVGRYQGLERVQLDGGLQDFVKVAYRDGDLLYLPVTALDELSRFKPASSDADVRLDRLGGQTWARRKEGVRDALLEKAQDLLRLQARRKLAARDPHPPPGALSAAVVARFPYAPTPDQARAFLDVDDDLSGDAPMDRLLCGDVGFGKTEVAIRAVARVVEGGRQAVILCPTTVLAFQHHLKLRDRFEGLPVRVAMLSRFSSPGEVKEVQHGLREGTVDVVVGTHKLLGREVRFARLGLAVIDEEHRFGVSQKDKLRALRTDVDVLSLSATPIPRTLQVALAGAREMSIMATAPEQRLEVRTTVARWGRTRVRDAILLELQRGGQAYVVHNRVESLPKVVASVREWVPEARVEMAHGQMSGAEIERLLVDFMNKRFDVLVCTAIIESGVDLPDVNTMLIDRADQFGLAQLYQLRGRVGRGDVRGNCLLLTPEEMNRDARKRIQVLVEHTRLGSGFAVAAADLELRGGGNLLGDAQHGHIDDVGFDTWVELLEEAVHAARGELAVEHLDPVLRVPVDAYIPEAFVPDVTRRLGWYKRLADAPRLKDLQAAVAELESELGDLPVEARHLADLAELRLLCKALGVVRLEWLKVRALLELHPASRVKPGHLAAFAAAHPKRVELGMGPPATVSVRFSPSEAERPLRFARWILARLDDQVRDGA